jgi:hypothetical protein
MAASITSVNPCSPIKSSAEWLQSGSEALAAAGVPVEQLEARGHFQASFTMASAAERAWPKRYSDLDCTKKADRVRRVYAGS